MKGKEARFSGDKDIPVSINASPGYALGVIIAHLKKHAQDI